MKNLLKLAAVPTIVAAATSANITNAATIVYDLEDVTNGGGFFAQITLTDIVDGQIRVVADIADPINTSLTQGDILGLGLNLLDDSVSYDVSATDAIGYGTDGSGNAYVQDPLTIDPICTTANSCDVLGFNGGGNNVQGQNMDMSFGIGINGSAEGFLQTVEFTIVDSFSSLTTADLLGEIGALRVQSIEGGAFDSIGSSKLAGPSEGGATEPEPEPAPEPSSLALLALGLAGVGFSRRMARK